jgi:mono/diheme cytochrome c family protein
MIHPHQLRKVIRMRLAPLAALLIAGSALAAAAELSPAAANGARVYAKVCLVCHQATGAGLPKVFPPLAGSDWVAGDPETLAKIVLHGLTGPVTVSGKKYASAMGGQVGLLTDEEIADVLTYVRSSWGNKADPVAAEVVTKVRTEFPKHAPWTVQQLTPAK